MSAARTVKKTKTGNLKIVTNHWVWDTKWPLAYHIIISCLPLW